MLVKLSIEVDDGRKSEDQGEEALVLKLNHWESTFPIYSLKGPVLEIIAQ